MVNFKQLQNKANFEQWYLQTYKDVLPSRLPVDDPHKPVLSEIQVLRKLNYWYFVYDESPRGNIFNSFSEYLDTQVHGKDTIKGLGLEESLVKELILEKNLKKLKELVDTI
mgnify:CR=1 FL=1|jgi:hypothetical protein